MREYIFISDKHVDYSQTKHQYGCSVPLLD